MCFKWSFNGYVSELKLYKRQTGSDEDRKGELQMNDPGSKLFKGVTSPKFLKQWTVP